MSAARIFPLAAPLFAPSVVRLTVRAKAILAAKGISVRDVLDRFLRLDWKDNTEFGHGMDDLRKGQRFYITMTRGVGVTCEPSKRVVIIETEDECLYRMDPKVNGPEGEWPEEIWGKGVYKTPACEIVKAASTEEAGA